MQDLKLWYDTSANKDWNKALPIGNGRLAAMVYGHLNGEILQLNEESVWYGKPVDRLNPNALKNLPKVRELLLNGEVSKAERLLKYNFTSIPQSQKPYQPLGEIKLNFYGQNEPISHYRRELDISNAIASVSYKCGDVKYERKILSSAVDDIIAVYITANKPASINLDAIFTRERFYDYNLMTSSNTIAMTGICSEGGVQFCAAAKAIAVGSKATVTTNGGFVIVDNADAVLLLISSYTSYNHADFYEKTIKKLDEIGVKPFEEIEKTHIDDYQKYFNRVVLDIENDDKEDLNKLPTDKRLERLKQGLSDNSLISLYFQFGRYLMLSCSRAPGILPTNLQGIWNNLMNPRWDSKYTININTQMNYWPAEVCNLPECHMPLFDHLEKMVPNGEKTAEKMYGCRGFVAHHNTDLWADTDTQDSYIPATFWVMGGAWLCLHIWEHYAFTKDIDFLREKYSIIKKAATFFIDFLIEDKDGYLVTCPSVSPENAYYINGEKVNVCISPTMDNQILRELFNACIEAGKILNDNDIILSTLKDMLYKLPPTKIGKHGNIVEWLQDYDEPDPGHKHISHLFGLYPGSQISPLTTPELAEAAIVTLNRRLQNGGGHTGWSRAWIINFWTRLFNSQKAYENIILLLTKSTLTNLFCDHPPFQIDGNFGGTAAIAEMLVQSHSNIIHLLPALPKQWMTGKVNGLKIRGNAEIDIEWDNCTLKFCSIKAYSNLDTRLLYNGKYINITITDGQSISVTVKDFD